MDNSETFDRGWMVAVGIALVAAGLIGFIPNPIASPDPNALFQVDAAHDVVHLLTGLIALGVGVGTRGMSLANATIGFGVLYMVVFVVCLVDPTVFGLFGDAPVNQGDHILHAVAGLVSLGAGAALRGDLSGAEAPR